MNPHTLVAVPIVRPEPALQRQADAARSAGAGMIELRVDLIGDADAVASLLGSPQPLPVVLTIRTREEGGCWNGSDDERAALFERLGGVLKSGAVDVEYATWCRSEKVRQTVERVCAGDGRQPRVNQLIISHHDLAGTPTDLHAVVAPLLASPADVVKVVFTALDATDAWRVLDSLRRHSSGRRMIALAMGEAGLLTRILAPKFGGYLTFAALSSGAESAPGQPTVEDLSRIYRWDGIGPQTRVFGVVGWPVSHSLSPHVHNVAMAAAGIDGVFVPMPVAPAYDDFVRFMDYQTEHPELGVEGLSVTLPHKEHALRWLCEHGFEVSELARGVGAVNTLSRVGSTRWAGENTDVGGAMAALRAVLAETGEELAGRDAVVLGAGGAARAVVIGLSRQGCRVTVVNRTPERAESLAHELHCRWRPWDERAPLSAEIVVNCTSVGMAPHVDAAPAPATALHSGMIVFDTVYNPRETRLLREARQRGCRVVDGVAMFIGQAERQFELWHGRGAPGGVMQSVLESSTL